jgi:hypothetical protein
MRSPINVGAESDVRHLRTGVLFIILSEAGATGKFFAQSQVRFPDPGQI